MSFVTPVVDQIVAQETRKRVYAYIKTHPGTHARRIQRELNLAWGDLEYHLEKLSGAGLVKMRRSGLYKFAFPANIFGEKQEVVLGLLSQKTDRDILLHIIQNPGITQRELAGMLGYSAPTICWHMDRLLRLGIVGRKRTGKTVAYEVIASREDILNFIRHYHPSVWERWASQMNDIILMLGSEDENAKE